MTATPPAGKNRRWLALLIPVAVIGVVLFGYLDSRPSFEGSLEMRSASGSRTLQPTVCLSGDGERPSFTGALLRDSWGASVRIEARRVVVSRPDLPDVELTAATCRTFDVGVAWGDARVDRVESIDGHARLDCALPDGQTFTGSFEFDTCSI